MKKKAIIMLAIITRIPEIAKIKKIELITSLRL